MMRQVRYDDRRHAGRVLAHALAHLDSDSIVVGLPRGGVPVAFEVAKAHKLPLDVILVRKLGVPFQPEVAMGAIGEGAVRVVNERVVQATSVSIEDIDAVERRERAELERRAERYRQGRPHMSLRGHPVVIIDDGIATGSTAKAACEVARAAGASRVVLAVPVAPPDWTERLGSAADEYVALAEPAGFHSVGQFYSDFGQTTDDEVVELLEMATPHNPSLASRDEDLVIKVDDVELRGNLVVPPDPFGLVIFAHGSGSSRHSPRNQLVAGVLNDAGLATLLFDLLTPQEEVDHRKVFDIEMLGGRLAHVTAVVRAKPGLDRLPVGLFGASTGAAAALIAAAEPGSRISSVVSRGGRPDLAHDHLAQVESPTLLIVGELDHEVLALNERAHAMLRCTAAIEVVPGATHLFEEPGTLAQAAELAAHWFTTHLRMIGV